MTHSSSHIGKIRLTGAEVGDKLDRANRAR